MNPIQVTRASVEEMYVPPSVPAIFPFHRSSASIVIALPSIACTIRSPYSIGRDAGACHCIIFQARPSAGSARLSMLFAVAVPAPQLIS